jgi:D-threo-aldose 1-dehydrogenase
VGLNCVTPGTADTPWVARLLSQAADPRAELAALRARQPIAGRLGFGGGPIGNLFTAVPDADARAAVDAAWQGGVRYFDTAPHYGLGLSERRLGAALRDRPREGYALATKVGRLLEPTPDAAGDDMADLFAVPASHRRVWDFSRDGVRRSLDSSLARLGVDRVDVLLLHDPDEHWQQALEEGYPALAELRSAGVIGAVGVGMNQTAMLTRFVRETEVDLVLVAGRYTLLDQSALADLLPACKQRGVSVLAAGVFNSGLLATPEPGGTYNYRPAPPQVRERAARVAAVCARHGVALPAAALHFPLAHPVVAAALVGVRSAAEVAPHLAALAGPPPPAALWQELRAEGLLAPDAPTP